MIWVVTQYIFILKLTNIFALFIPLFVCVRGEILVLFSFGLVHQAINEASFSLNIPSSGYGKRNGQDDCVSLY